MNRLFSIQNNNLVELSHTSLDQERKIEDWVCNDLTLVGIHGIIIGRQVKTDHGKIIDVLAMDQDGNLIVIELKRDRSPRDIVAQILDYASWVYHLKTNDIYEITQSHIKKSLEEIYKEKFNCSPPEKLNGTHQMIIVASEFDPATKRIIEYLSEVHDVGINAVFFNIFDSNNTQWLTTDTLLEQEEVTYRATKKNRGPWTGYYYVTGGKEEARPWDDMKNHGFITASGGAWYSNRLSNLSDGDKVFYYQVGNGYLGYGIVTTERFAASNYELSKDQKITDVIKAQYLNKNQDDPDKCAYVVGIKWKKTFNKNEAKTYQGIFAKQHTVCKMYDQQTVDFLKREFEIE